MPSHGEIIKELTEKLERKVTIVSLNKIKSMEELKECKKLRAKKRIVIIQYYRLSRWVFHPIKTRS